MEILIICATVVAVIHYLYESILLPTIRVQQRFNLFKLRDELRTLMIEQKSTLNPVMYQYLQSSINGTISSLHKIDLLGIYNYYIAEREHPEITEKVRIRQEEMENYQNDSFQSLRKKQIEIVKVTLFANMGLFCFLMIPIALLCLAIKTIKEKICLYIFQLASISESVGEKLLGNDSLNVA